MATDMNFVADANIIHAGETVYCYVMLSHMLTEMMGYGLIELFHIADCMSHK